MASIRRRSLFRPTAVSRGGDDDGLSSDEATYLATRKNTRTSSWLTNWSNRSSSTDSEPNPQRMLEKLGTPVSKTKRDLFQPRLGVECDKGMALPTMTTESGASSQVTSLEWEDDTDTYTSQVIYHGEAQTQRSLWNKSKEYLVLTEKYLYRYKSRNRAAAMFHDISKQKRHLMRAQSTPPGGLAFASPILESPGLSWGELPEQGSCIELHHVFAVCISCDSKPHFALALYWFNDLVMRPCVLNLVFQDRGSGDQWLAHISKQALQAGSRLESRSHWIQDEDLDGDDYTAFRIVKHVDREGAVQGSNEDAPNGIPQLAFLAVGQRKIHFIPIQNFGSYESHGIAALTSVDISDTDSRIKFTFRLVQPMTGCLKTSTNVMASLYANVVQQTSFSKAETVRMCIRRNCNDRQ